MICKVEIVSQADYSNFSVGYFILRRNSIFKTPTVLMESLDGTRIALKIYYIMGGTLQVDDDNT